MQHNQRGFTLIELVVVVIIIGVLAAASVPIYRGYIRKSTLSEARSVAGSIATSQKIYYTEYNNVIASGPIGTPIQASTLMGIDIGSNKYFNQFAIPTVAGTGVSATYTGYIFGNAGSSDSSGITVTIMQTMNAFPTITDNL